MHLTLSSTISRTIRSAIAGLMIAPLVPLVAFAQSSPTGAPAGAAAVEQRAFGVAPPARLVASFDGLGVGFRGPQGEVTLRNPSDNSLAVGRDHIVQTVNSRMAIFTKRGTAFRSTGEPLFGPVPTHHVFRGFGGPCEERNNGDAVVRYDHLADRWLLVMPIFSRVAPRTSAPGPRRAALVPPTPASAAAAAAAPSPPPATGGYAMCYAISAGSDPLGDWDRYEFARPLFPDYPRPAVWPDGYYVPTSTGDEVVEKHVCVVDRVRMLAGQDATEQCIIVKDVNFLNTADLDGRMLPPAGAPNIVLAAGGTQLRGEFEADAIFAWRFFVDWTDPARTRLEGPQRIAVAPYRYLCGGQLTTCVPQPGTDRRLDAQGDKLMARVVYRRFATHEALVAVHSVNTMALGGGVRWYELRLDQAGAPVLHQQGTFAPDGDFRWMASPAIDAYGNIGIGYSFGGERHFPGQRFVGRTARDPLGSLPFAERVLVEGEAAQTTTLRWQDYTQTALDPVDDCTVWYVGDYLKRGAASYSTRIGAFRMPGCPTEGAP